VAEVVSSYRWPEGIPPGCPPPDAQPAAIDAYRLVSKDPPSDTDFVRPIDKPHEPAETAEEECSLYALSVFTDPADVNLAQQFIPGFKKKLVALGHIEPEHGVLRQLPLSLKDRPILHSHRDWWVTHGFDAKTTFAVVTL
jgi:hypothetical protein